MHFNILEVLLSVANVQASWIKAIIQMVIVILNHLFSYACA